jgi:WD40 repeat protein
MYSEIDIHSPVNSIYIIQDKLIVACGGGPGLKNKLILYQLQPGYIGQKLNEIELEQTPKFIEGIPSKKIFGICCENQIIFYSISQDWKSFKITYTLSIEPKDSVLISFKINNNILAIGDIDGELKLFNITLTNNEIVSANQSGFIHNAHWRGINKIDFILKNNMKFLITASGDGNCKIFNITDLSKPIELLSNFSFRQSYSETANYCMNDLLLIPEQNIAYTIQSSKNDKKAKSFLTKWDVSNVNLVQPLETINISNLPCSSLDLTENKKYLGITDVQGKIFFVKTNGLKICGGGTIGENQLKCCKFYNNYLVTGSVAYKLRIDKLKLGFNMDIFKYLLYVVIILGFYYYIHLKKNNLIDDI